MANIQNISALMNKAVKRNIFPGGVLLCAKKNDILFYEGYGKSNIYRGINITKNTIFDLASLTKPLSTALVILKLIEKKQIQLSDKIESILPESKKFQIGQVTIDMLLRHTSGLPAYKEYYKQLSGSYELVREELRQLIIREKLENPPGEVQVYSDLGFILLAWIMETITGKRIDKLSYDYIYKPLGVDHLFFVDLEKTKHKEKENYPKFAATQHCPWRKKLLVGEVDDDNAWVVGGVEGHAGLFGDAFSVYKICLELLKTIKNDSPVLIDPFILKSFLEKKNSFDMVAGFDTPSKENSSAGGFFSKTAIGHLGFTGTSFWIDPTVNLIVVLLTNRVHPLRSNEAIKKFRPVLHDLVHSAMA